MNSSRLKIALSILFLAVNLFFLHKIITITNSDNTFSDTEINEAISLVSAKGVNISPDNILKERKTPKTLKLEWDVQSIDGIVKEIVQSEYGSFKIPNGHSFTNDTEKFSIFYDYSFEYKCLDTSESIQTVTDALNEGESKNSKKIKKYRELLKKLTKKISSNDFEISIDVIRLAEKETKDYIYVSQYINGCNVDGAGFVAVFENDALIFASGTFYISGHVSKYSTNSHDSINILFRLDASESEIIKTEKYYFPVSENDSSVYLTPSYKFTYNDGSTVLLDATSGMKRK